MAGSMDQLSSVLIDDTLRHDHVSVFAKHNRSSITFGKNRHNGVWSWSRFFCNWSNKQTAQINTLMLIVAIFLNRFRDFALFKYHKRTRIKDTSIECALTRLHQALLFYPINGSNNVPSLKFTTALALECFKNDYIFLENGYEKQMIELIEEHIESAFQNGK